MTFTLSIAEQAILDGDVWKLDGAPPGMFQDRPGMWSNYAVESSSDMAVMVYCDAFPCGITMDSLLRCAATEKGRM